MIDAITSSTLVVPYWPGSLTRGQADAERSEAIDWLQRSGHDGMWMSFASCKLCMRGLHSHIPATIDLDQIAKHINQKPSTVSVCSEAEIILNIFNIVGLSLLGYKLGRPSDLCAAVSQMVSTLLVQVRHELRIRRTPVKC